MFSTVCKLFYSIYHERKGLCCWAGKTSLQLCITLHADVQATSIQMCSTVPHRCAAHFIQMYSTFHICHQKGSLIRWSLYILSNIVCPGKPMFAIPRRQYHIFCRKYKIHLCIFNPLSGLSFAWKQSLL